MFFDTDKGEKQNYKYWNTSDKYDSHSPGVFLLCKFVHSKQIWLSEMKFMVHQQRLLQEQGAWGR